MENGKRNCEIDILKGLGIVFVVFGHCGQSTGVFAFTPYSFHMPLFIFCSGYFFSELVKGNLKTLLKYLRKLIFPLLIWGSIYYIVISIFNRTLLEQVRNHIFLKGLFNEVLIASFTGYYAQNLFMTACWFVGCLFWVKIYFQFIHTRLISFLKPNKLVQMCFLLFYGGISIFAVQVANNLYEINGFLNIKEIIILRVAFSGFFYYLGMFVRCHLQESINKFKWVLLFGSYIIMNLMYNTGIVLDFWMDRMLFKTRYLSLVTSVLGILFFYIIAQIWSANKCEFIKKVGEKSMSILQHHLFLMYMINQGLYVLGRISKEDASMLYYRFHGEFSWPIYCSLAILLPMLGAWLWSQKMRFVHRRQQEIGQGKP